MGRVLLRLLAASAITVNALFGTAAAAHGNIAAAVLFGIGLSGALWLRHLATRRRR